MTRGDLYNFVTELLDGRKMNVTTFGTFLNLAKAEEEEERPWVILRAEDSSKTVSAGDSFEDFKTLPSRFLMPYYTKRTDGEYSAIVLRNGDSVRHVREIPFAQRQERKDDTDLFFIDHANSQYAFTGTRDISYTIHLYYIQYSQDLKKSSDTWVFPSRYHPLLGYKVARMEKIRDYDEVNKQNASDYQFEIQTIKDAMTSWDDKLQRTMLQV